MKKVILTIGVVGLIAVTGYQMKEINELKAKHLDLRNDYQELLLMHIDLDETVNIDFKNLIY
jgi:hypothetical protein